MIDAHVEHTRIAAIIPAFNEGESLASVLESLPTSIFGHSLIILVVDDGSTDGTASVGEAGGAKVIRHRVNLGQGAAIRTGMKRASEFGAQFALSLDADGQHDPHQIETVIWPILGNEADFVIGSRFLGGSLTGTPERVLAIRVLSIIASIITGQRVTDPTSGFRAWNLTSLGNLKLHEDQFNALELIIQARKHRLRLVEVPVTMKARVAGQSKKPRIRYLVGLLRALLLSMVR